MRRPIAMIAAAGISLGAATPLADGERVLGGPAEAEPTVELLYREVQQDILPRLGTAGLKLVELVRDDTIGHVALLLTFDSYCGTQFSFETDDYTPERDASVGFTLYGRLADLQDRSKINGHAMWDGTIGHGDNVAHTPFIYQPGNNENADQVVEHMRHNSALACAQFPDTPNL